MLNKTAKTRMNKLIKFMASLPKSAEEHFSMGSWFKHRGRKHTHKLAVDGTVTRATLKGCGTSACAAGWAATIPEFRRAGFKLSAKKGFSIDPGDFFLLDWDQRDQLFFNFQVNTPKEWAAMAQGKMKQWAKR